MNENVRNHNCFYSRLDIFLFKFLHGTLKIHIFNFILSLKCYVLCYKCYVLPNPHTANTTLK